MEVLAQAEANAGRVPSTRPRNRPAAALGLHLTHASLSHPAVTVPGVRLEASQRQQWRVTASKAHFREMLSHAFLAVCAATASALLEDASLLQHLAAACLAAAAAMIAWIIFGGRPVLALTVVLQLATAIHCQRLGTLPCLWPGVATCCVIGEFRPPLASRRSQRHLALLSVALMHSACLALEGTHEPARLHLTSTFLQLNAGAACTLSAFAQRKQGATPFLKLAIGKLLQGTVGATTAMLFCAHWQYPLQCKVQVLLMGILGMAAMVLSGILPVLTLWLVPSQVRATPAFQGVWTGWSASMLALCHCEGSSVVQYHSP